MTTTRTLRRRTVAAALLAPVLLSSALAGCGGTSTVTVDPAENEAGRKFKNNAFRTRPTKGRSRSHKGQPTPPGDTLLNSLTPETAVGAGRALAG